MNAKLTRRNILKLAGGSVVGLFFTPIPYKLLDDSSIWTQNWPWVPVPSRGPVSFQRSRCTLCASGCVVKARMIGQEPVSLSASKTAPGTIGGLCAIGLGAHHLSYHPLRVVHPLRLQQNGDTVSLQPTAIENILSSIAQYVNEREGSIAIFDSRRCLSTSLLYQRFLAGIPNSMHVTYSTIERELLNVAEEIAQVPTGSFDCDLENAKTIVSFGAPLFDGWGSHQRMVQLWSNRLSTGLPSVIQVESRFSKTASLADRWIAPRPGSEAALARGLAHLLIKENLVQQPDESPVFLKLIEEYTTTRTSELTGIDADSLVHLAREISHGQPSVVIACGDPGAGPLERETLQAIHSLNLLLGSVGRRGGILRYVGDDSHLQIHSMESIPDHSVKLLFLDAYEPERIIPWRHIRQKLADDALVVSFSPFVTGLAKRANFILPTPSPFESTVDLLTTNTQSGKQYSISRPLRSVPRQVMMIDTVLQKLAASLNLQPLPGSKEIIKQQLAAIHQSGRGFIQPYGTNDAQPVSGITSVDDSYSMLVDGGCWIEGRTAGEFHSKPIIDRVLDAPAIAARVGVVQNKTLKRFPLTLTTFGYPRASSHSSLSPLLTKIYQESGLRKMQNEALVHPESAAEFGIVDGDEVLISTVNGKKSVRIRIDRSVMPGVIMVALGVTVQEFTETDKSLAGSILGLCDTSGSSWRTTPAAIQKA